MMDENRSWVVFRAGFDMCRVGRKENCLRKALKRWGWQVFECTDKIGLDQAILILGKI